MKSSDIPEGPHYAIMVIGSTSVTIPGDERSRTNPGHGYPEHTATHDNIDYYAFGGDLVRWKEETKRLFMQEQNGFPPFRRQVVAFHVDSVVRPKLTVEVELDHDTD